jgi:hypothetical protein
MIAESTLRLPITAGGGTITLPLSDSTSIVELYTSGSVTLVAHQNITYSGTPRNGYTMWILSNLTNLTLDVYNLTLFGEVINETIVENTLFLARATYSSGAGKFLVTVFPDFEGTGFIEGSHLVNNTVDTNQLADDAVTLAKLNSITRGSIIVGGVAEAPTLLNAKTSGHTLIGDGTDIKSVPMSGDVTISSTGVTTIGANKITEAMLNFTLTSYLEVSRTLTSAEILALRTTAIPLLSAPGVNKYYELISVSAYNNYNSTTYNAGTDVLNLEVNGVALWTLPNTFIEATSSTATYGTKVADALIATNTAVNLRMSSADPTTGNGTIKISAIYRIITGE